MAQMLSSTTLMRGAVTFRGATPELTSSLDLTLKPADGIAVIQLLGWTCSYNTATNEVRSYFEVDGRGYVPNIIKALEALGATSVMVDSFGKGLSGPRAALKMLRQVAVTQPGWQNAEVGTCKVKLPPPDATAPVEQPGEKKTTGAAAAADVPIAEVLAAVTGQLQPAIETASTSVRTASTATELAQQAQGRADHFQSMSFRLRGAMGAEARKANKRVRLEMESERAMRLAAEKRETQLIALLTQQQATTMALVSQLTGARP